MDEAQHGFREMGKHFTHKRCKLCFRFRRNYGIIHGVAPFWVVDFGAGYYTLKSPREGRLFLLNVAQMPAKAQQFPKMGKLQANTHLTVRAKHGRIFTKFPQGLCAGALVALG